MAIPRDSLTALDGFDDHIDWHSLTNRSNDRFLNWLGSGSFLTAHLAIFGTTLLGAFAWSLIDHPTDLSNLAPFRYWGMIVVAHLVLTGVYQFAVRVLGWNANVPVTDAPPIYRPAQPVARPAVPARVWATSVEGASKVNTTARRWAAASTKRGSTRPADNEPGDWPAQPPILQNAEKPDVGEVTWPSSVPRSTALNGSAEAAQRPADELVSIDHTSSTPVTEDRAQSWLEGFVESRSGNKEQRWSWVEAAAASWLSKRDAPAPLDANEQRTEDVVVSADLEKDPDSPDQSA